MGGGGCLRSLRAEFSFVTAKVTQLNFFLLSRRNGDSDKVSGRLLISRWCFGTLEPNKRHNKFHTSEKSAVRFLLLLLRLVVNISLHWWQRELRLFNQELQQPDVVLREKLRENLGSSRDEVDITAVEFQCVGILSLFESRCNVQAVYEKELIN